ncbi:hypothetical protein [Fluoribacter gormanii]|uniref:Uncharacterized protein n=1 Tax=Fluoribacter gormanii TaxID=464 RepID=A0A377GHL0_9GAMM|nr:hypothetical protein [Fluoribacter gormanii]KTD01330.1 hypothetical protein Lgor_2396 [Fluoribacter gormanii]MCW8444174.1 hypothetical protein [Fluoribacter gormanii]SIR90522.1 hypothetical protein SAMN05421777_14013 [Fluoribacter gormanii]STO24261.1 Uncharacterised protein [Fluoribacter gormanii]
MHSWSQYSYDDLEGYRVTTLVNKADVDYPLAMEPLSKKIERKISYYSRRLSIILVRIAFRRALQRVFPCL